MERIEQRVMMKYFFLNRHRSKLIHKRLVSPLHDNAISLSTVKNWLKRFKFGGLSCSDEERSGRPLISLGPALQRFLNKFSFASAQVVAGHFLVDRSMIKSILDRELGLRKFTRRWVPHILSAEQKLRRVTESQSLLTIYTSLAEKNRQEIMPGDESWFVYVIESEAMFTSSLAEATSTV
jgi:transposase